MIKTWKEDWQKPKTKRNNQIIKYKAEGKTIAWLSRHYNLSRNTIGKILHKQAKNEPVNN